MDALRGLAADRDDQHPPLFGLAGAVREEGFADLEEAQLGSLGAPAAGEGSQHRGAQAGSQQRGFRVHGIGEGERVGRGVDGLQLGGGGHRVGDDLGAAERGQRVADALGQGAFRIVVGVGHAAVQGGAGQPVVADDPPDLLDYVIGVREIGPPRGAGDRVAVGRQPAVGDSERFKDAAHLFH